MKRLLDTHAFIWLNSAPERLSPKVRDCCKQGAARVYLSLVTPWEMQIKRQLGKLKYEPITDRIVRDNLDHNNIDLLPISLAHIEQLAQVPMHHRESSLLPAGRGPRSGRRPSSPSPMRSTLRARRDELGTQPSRELRWRTGA